MIERPGTLKLVEHTGEIDLRNGIPLLVQRLICWFVGHRKGGGMVLWYCTRCGEPMRRENTE